MSGVCGMRCFEDRLLIKVFKTSKKIIWKVPKFFILDFSGFYQNHLDDRCPGRIA